MDEATTISAAGWGTRMATLHQATPGERASIRDRLLGPMDPAIARSFTEDQVRELERVLAAAPARRLPIDIRITVPFFRRGFFITFLAGPEHRSAERLKEERAKHALWTVANVCCFVFLFVLFIPTFIGLVHIFVKGH
jgi:hypothetical protein